MRYRRIFVIIECMCKSTIELQLKSLFTCFENWMQKLLSCKVEKFNKFAEFFSDNRVDFSILFIEFWHIKSHLNFSLLHTLTHNSIRHRRIFDIIEFVCKFIIELQMRSKMKQLEHWVQKLCYCKNWETDLIAEFFRRHSRRSLYFIYKVLTLKKYFFEKNINERFCINIKTRIYRIWEFRI